MTKIDELLLTPRKAVIIDRTAIISDLHLGIESMMEGRSVTFPRVQIQEIIGSLRSIINDHAVKKVIIAGDLKQEFSRNLPYEWEDVELFLKTFSDIPIEIIRGNHDNYLSSILSKYRIELKDSLKVGKYTIIHGHRKLEKNGLRDKKRNLNLNLNPSINKLNLIIGHEHPAIKIRKSGALYRYPCYLHSKERNILVLPAFSPLSQGTDILTANSFLSPILNDEKVKLDDVDVYAVEGDVLHLGKVKDIKKAGIV